MTALLESLIVRLDLLLADLAAAEGEHAGAIAAVAPCHRTGAVNLVHYMRLRRHDLRELQHDLLDTGASSLATTEPNVRAKIAAARTVVAALGGERGAPALRMVDQALGEGDDLLAANSHAIFGPMRPGRPTRIMVTLPSEAADEPGLVADLVDVGMDVARVNCAHDDTAAWTDMCRHLRAAADAAGRRVLVSMDLPGPKLRTGPIADGPAVGRARVTRDESGQVLTTAKLWLRHSDASPAPPPAEPGARPTLAVRVEGTWLQFRLPGDRIAVRDARGPRRTFVVTQVGRGGVLAEGRRSAYIADGAELLCQGQSTAAMGIVAVPRRLSLAVGDQLVLTSDLAAVELPAPGQNARIGCTLPEAIASARPGEPVLLDDGAIAGVVESVTAAEVTVRITRTKPGGQRLGAQKGINFPQTRLPLNALTADDDAHLPFIAEHADMVAVSFVRTATDIEHILARLAASGAGDLGLVLKIETREGFENLPEILLVAMRHPRLAVMIARGDLAVELGFERMSEVPRQILALCEAAHVPAIWATQVLETLAKTGLPSRAEITDAAAAQRADCVMLNKGPYILDAVKTLDDILVRMGNAQHKSRTLLRHIHSWDAAVAH